jgi:hypothetical protein
MLKTINVILVCLMLGGAGVVYLMKYDSERAAGRISRLQHDIVEKRQQIASLKAEWSMLNQPRRIQELVEKYRSYLELDALDPNQVASIEEIPLRQAAKTDMTTPDPNKPVSRMLAIGKPSDLTGSLPKKSSDAAARKAVDRTDPLAMPRTIDPKPNDPINALIR